MTEKKTVVRVNSRVDALEQMIKPLVMFAPQLELAQRRNVKVVDIGIKLEQLRTLVDCAIEVAERDKPEGKGNGEQKENRLRARSTQRPQAS
jgi:carbamoylphosphate synthase small subunit